MIEPIFAAPPRPVSLKRRLLDSGLGGGLALAYWGVVAVCFVLFAVSLAIFMGPAWILLLGLVCAGAWGLGLLLCAVAALLTIARQMRRAAVSFLIVSGAAQIGLAVLAVLLYAAIEIFFKLSGK
jgi:hypothetical protein